MFQSTAFNDLIVFPEIGNLSADPKHQTQVKSHDRKIHLTKPYNNKNFIFSFKQIC